MKVYILIADVGSYSDRTVNNLAVFLDKEKAESKMAELTKVPEAPENWLELYTAERENALANFNLYFPTNKNRFEDKSYEGHHFFFPEPKDWKNYNYRAKYSSDELYFEELEVSE